MPSHEKIAVAAHLHVLLRRKTGRVTDTEWMAANADYAHEIARFAREKAVEGGHGDLAVWADKLEKVMALPDLQPPVPLVRRVADAMHRSSAHPQAAPDALFAESRSHSAFGDSQLPHDLMPRPGASRYVKGLR